MGEDTVKRFLLGTIVVAACLFLLAGTVLGRGTLIASYTLNETAVDQTGRNDDITLTNAPYEEGGVYLNGLYDGTEPDGSKIQTLPVTDLDFSALSVRIDFKISDYPSYRRPILYCGSSWRWMGAGLNSSGHLYLTYNTITGPAGPEPVTLDTWHTLVMTYDGTAGHLFLDGEEVASQVFTPNFNNDSRFVSHNGGEGRAFKGHLRNLAVYNGVISRDVGVAPVEMPGAATLLRNFPNPFNPVTTIAFSLSAPATASLGVYDLSGRLLQVLVKEERLGAGDHDRLWNGTDLHGRVMPSGTYIYRLEASDYIETRMMTLMK